MPRGGKPFFTAEQDQEVVRRYLAGETLNAIGDSYGVSWGPVRAALKRCGIERRSSSDYYWKPTPENRAELVRLWKEGLGVQKIAKQVRTDNEKVSRYLREEGIQPRFGGRNKRFKGNEVEALAAEHLAGVSLAELGRRHNCSAVVIRNTLKRAGVEIKVNGGHPLGFWTPERVEWLREQYESGRSQEEIANEIGYSQVAISSQLRDRGIRPPRKQPRGSASPYWQGGRYTDKQGYVRILVPVSELHLAGRTIGGGYVMEHRLVMARILGRPLLKTETVHHIDGDKANNSPGNLQLRQGNHGKGIVLQCSDCGSRRVEAVPLT